MGAQAEGWTTTTRPDTLCAMGRVGLLELILILVVLCAGLALPFLLGFFIGKGVGFKEGLREAERRHGPPR
jgi:hypothetical protein